MLRLHRIWFKKYKYSNFDIWVDGFEIQTLPSLGCIRHHHHITAEDIFAELTLVFIYVLNDLISQARRLKPTQGSLSAIQCLYKIRSQGLDRIIKPDVMRKSTNIQDSFIIFTCINWRCVRMGMSWACQDHNLTFLQAPCLSRLLTVRVLIVSERGECQHHLQHWDHE